MASTFEKILDGQITSDDLTDPCQIVTDQDEKEKLKEHNIGELVPFLLNYLREKTLHHLTPRQSAAPTPKKTSGSHGKGAVEKAVSAGKGSSRENLLPPQKTPSPSPDTPLSQSQRDKVHGQYSSSSLLPNFKRKSSKEKGNEKISPLVTQPKLNINDPNDFPPMGLTSGKKVTPSRRITPTQVKNDGKKGKSSPAFSSSSFSSSHSMLDSHGSPASLQEERDILKLMKSKRKNKGDSPWGNRTSSSAQTGIRYPPLHVFGDFIVTPPKHATTMPDTWQKNNSKSDYSLISTPSYKCPNTNEASDILTADPLSCQQSEKQSCIEKIQPVQAVKDKVNFHNKLDALAKIYSRCIMENLVPNVTAEVYFVVQLLTARGIAPDSRQEENHGNNADDENILDSIHNSTYFAVTVLEEIKRLVLLLDKETLRLLADNQQIADFLPSLKETFCQQYKTCSVKKVSEMSFVKSPLGGVPFSVERDNKQNFPTDRAFHNFRKQSGTIYLNKLSTKTTSTENRPEAKHDDKGDEAEDNGFHEENDSSACAS